MAALAVSAFAVGLSASAVQAQPVGAPGARSEEQRRIDEQTRVAFTKQNIEPLLRTNAAGALQEAQGFLVDNPNLHPLERVRFFREAGTRVFDAFGQNNKLSAQERLESDTALFTFLEAGLQESSRLEVPQPRESLQMQRLMVLLQMRQNQLPAAQERLAANWNDAMGSPDFLTWVKLRQNLYMQQGQEKEVVPMVRLAIEQRLKSQNQFDTSLCQHLAEVLREQGDAAASLSWARLNFMLCGYNDSETATATRILARTWMYDLSSDEIAAFLGAQTDADTANPLSKVALPVFDAPFQELLKASTVQARANGDIPALISLLIVQGDYRGAMMQARNRLASEMGNEESVRQVARVFKAKDLSLARANQFVSFFGSGKGNNPLTQFLREEVPGADAAPVAAVAPTTEVAVQ
jgi:hypothetical protein